MVSDYKHRVRAPSFYEVHRELTKYQVVNDFEPYPEVLSRINKLRVKLPDGQEVKGHEALLKLIGHVYNRPVEMHEAKYKESVERLRKMLEALPHDALIFVGRSTLNHVVPRSPLWTLLQKHAEKGTAYWLNTRRERDINWSHPVDPHSKFAIAAIRNLAKDIVSLATKQKKRKFRLVLLDDVIGTGKTIIGIGRTLVKEVEKISNGRVRIEVIPVALIGNPLSFLISSGLINDKEIPLHDYKKAHEAAKKLLEVANYVSYGVRIPLNTLKSIRNLGVDEEVGRRIARRLRRLGLYPPFFAIFATTQDFNPFSHAISDAIEDYYQANHTVHQLGDLLHQAEELLAYYNNLLEQEKAEVRKRVKMYPRTRPQ